MTGGDGNGGNQRSIRSSTVKPLGVHNGELTDIPALKNVGHATVVPNADDIWY